jgi:membrane protease YdiL (CAAX protease family)
MIGYFSRYLVFRKPPRQLSVPWGLSDALAVIVTALVFQLVVTMALMQLSGNVPEAAHWLEQINTGDLSAILLLNLLNLLAGLGVVAWFLNHYGVGLKAVGWRRVDLERSALYTVGILVAFQIGASLVLGIVSLLAPVFGPNQIQHAYFIGTSPQNRFMAFVALVILPPLLEETVFRGFVFPALAKHWGVVWGAVISSAIFGIAHAQITLSIYTFVLGLLLCFMYTRLKSIFPGMALHMINNLVAFVALANSK